MASTSTRPLLSAATVKPHSTDLAKESSTDRRSAGLVLEERNDSLPCTSSTFGPTRWKETSVRAAFLPAVEADVVRAEAGGEAGGIEEFGVEARDLQPQVAGAFVPIEREIAVDFLHAGGAFLDARYGSGGGCRATAPGALLGGEG